jgi:hypothetical protein
MLRTALALNNMGISLLQKHCYVQALETLCDAFSLIKSTVTDQKECQSSFGAETAARKHQQALQRLARPMVCKRPVMIIEALIHEQSSDTARSILQETRSCKFFAIRIEDVADISGCDESGGLNLELAILSHNLGIAYFCISLVSRSSGDIMLMSAHKTVKYQRTAVRLFRISHSLCRKARPASMKSSMQYPELLYTTAVVLNSLIEVFQCFGHHAEPFLSMLAQVKAAILAVETSSEIYGWFPQGAGAA